MTWSVLIEEWTSESLAFVPDLPGFQITGDTPDDAFTTAKEVVGRYVAWLTEGELIPDDFLVHDLELSEKRVAVDGAGPLFLADQIAPAADHVELALAVGRAALSDLLFVRDDVPAESRNAADQVLRHVAEMDRWYAMRISEANGKPFTSIEDELVQSASLFEETIDLAIESNRTESWTIDGEQWSLAKVLRRRTGHLREHLPQLMAFVE